MLLIFYVRYVGRVVGRNLIFYLFMTDFLLLTNVILCYVKTAGYDCIYHMLDGERMSAIVSRL